MIPTFVGLIATHNAEEHLKDCIKSLNGCTHVIIWDQKSTDETRNIATSFGCNVIDYPATFYEEPETQIRNKMTDYVNTYYPNSYIVSQDSDEILSDNWHSMATELILSRQPAGIRVPYWQLMGDARYMQYGNPIEKRILIFAPGAGPRYSGDGTTRWHQTTPHCNGPVVDLPSLNFIHLGYTGDLRRRYSTNCKRKDWSDRDDVNKDFLDRISKDPFVFTQPVVPTAQELLTSSSILQDITKRHAATREVTLDGHGPAMKIKHITYK